MHAEAPSIRTKSGPGSLVRSYIHNPLTMHEPNDRQKFSFDMCLHFTSVEIEAEDKQAALQFLEEELSARRLPFADDICGTVMDDTDKVIAEIIFMPF